MYPARLRSTALLRYRAFAGQPCRTQSVEARATTGCDRVSPSSGDVAPPFKRHRDATSVLRALASCVKRVPGSVDFRLGGGDPWFSNSSHTRNFLVAKAKGRMAARMAMNEYFPNDIVGVAKEVPRVDQWLPLQSPDVVLDGVTNGTLAAVVAMDRLLQLIAPEQAWKLYKDVAPDEKWSSDTLHRLLDLLCATNSGKGAFQTFATLSNSDEEYFLDELNKRSEYQDKGATKPASALRLHSNSETAAVEGDESGSSQGDLVAQSDGDVDRSASSELHEREMEHMEPAPAADVWLLHSPAEQLFVREREVLSTVAAYCSLIRGAAKFNNPSRALEVADLAWNGPEGNGALDVVTYCTLIRSLHHLPAVKSGDEDVWEYLKSLLNRLATSGEPVNDFVFSSSIYVLANVAQKNGDRPYASNALPLGFGLLSEMQKLGISPSLGVAARLLQLIESTEQSDVKSMPRRSNQAGFSGYSCATFLHSFLTEMELRFTACSPSRFDDWSIDDYFFFPVAMQMAVRENNLDLALRINHLLEDNSDRRYLLRTSLHNRNYFQDYCRLTLRRYPSDNASPLKAVQRFRDVYAMQCDTVCASYRLCTQLLRGLAFYLQWKDNRATRDSKSCERELHTMSYTLLCTLTNDLLATVRSSGPVRLSENICYAIAVLSSHAHLDRPTAASISGRILDRFLQADDKSLLANDQLSQCSVDSQTIEQIVRLAFPPQADSEADRWGSGGGSNATVSGWLGYSASHQLLSWNWTPQALVISWTDENGCDIELVWKVVEKLTQLTFSPSSSNELAAVTDALLPLLTELEQTLQTIHSSQTPEVIVNQRRVWIEQLRRLLKEASETLPTEKSDNYSDKMDYKPATKMLAV